MSIPLSDYKNGSSFNEETYKGADTKAKSCCAFAKYVYLTNNSKETGTDCKSSTIDKIPTGAILKCTHSGGTHWMIVGSHYTDKTNGDGFNIYDANWVDPPRTKSPYAVSYRKMSYEAFNKKFTISSATKP